MEVSSQLQKTAPPFTGRFTAGKEPGYPLNRGLRGSPEPVWAIWRGGKSFFRGIRTPDRMFRSLVIRPPTLTLKNTAIRGTVHVCISDGSQKTYGLFFQTVRY
jgi:hypothetical protein